MLRTLVLVLLLVNAAFLAWAQGWLNAVVGVRPDGQHEPARLQAQQHAGRAEILPPKRAKASARAASVAASSVAASAPAPGGTDAPASAALSGQTVAASAIAQPSGPSAAASGAPAAPACIEAGPFSATEWPGAEGEIKRTLPVGHWTTQPVAVSGLWLVYMGPYPDADQLERKQTELRRIKGLNFEEVRTPANLAQGLSLGRYTRAEDADQALNQLRNRGIRTARVVNVRPPMTVQILRVPAATEAQQAKLNALKLPANKGFVACR